MNVTTTPVSLGEDAQLVQNLGAGDVYIGARSDVSSTNGFKVANGDAVSLDYSNSPWFVVSASTSDVRSLVGGHGVFGL